MAASSVASMQSVFLANPVTAYGAGKTKSSVGVVAPTLQRLPHRRQSSVVANASKTPSPPPPTPPKVSTNFLDLFAFSGPAPERINGRLAMVGFVAALGGELYKGQDVFAQLSDGGVSLFVATSVLLSAASLVPLLKGVSAESKSDGVMTSDAEMWNGRMAMLGLVALVFTEYVKGGTLV